MKWGAALLLLTATAVGCEETLADGSADAGFDGADAAATPSPQVAWLEDGAIDVEALVSWVRGGAYNRWERSPSVFRSTAGGGSRIYLNPVLATSLADGDAAHPYGAVGVREVYFDDLQTLRGVNVTVKVVAGAEDAGNWFFVELFDLAPGGLPSLAEPGGQPCLLCHSAASDFVQSTWPLQETVFVDPGSAGF